MKDGAKVFIKNPKLDKYLFVLRDNKKGIPHPNMWGQIGGGIEEGEEPLEALAREVKEEIGIELSYVQLLGSKEYDIKVDRDIKTLVGYLYLGYTDKVASEIVLTEGQRIDYFTLEEKLSDRSTIPAVKESIKEYKDKL